MLETPKNLYYWVGPNNEHLWFGITKEELVLVGITDYGQQEMGDINGVDILENIIMPNEAFAVLESNKATQDLALPFSGKIIETNSLVGFNRNATPEIVNDDPYGTGWLFKIEIELSLSLVGLMTSEEYDQYVKKERV